MRRMWRVVATYPNGTSTYHYQTRRAAEYRRDKLRDGYTVEGTPPYGDDGYEVPAAVRVTIERSDPITWTEGPL